MAADPPGLTVRPATAADAGVISAFNVALAAESEGLALAPATVAAGVAACLADPAKGFYTVAEVGGGVVGMVLVTFEWTDWRNGWFWWLQSVYVAPAARRRGVLTALYRHLRDRAAGAGVVGLRLYVEQANAAGHAAYAALGLTSTGYGVLEDALGGTPGG